MAFIRPSTILRLYFVFVSVALLWMFFSYGVWCPEMPRKSRTDTSKLTMAQRENMLLEKEAALSRMADNLYKLERQLQQQYPLQFAQAKSLSLIDMPLLYIITPTHTRPEQKAELTRLSQTLLHVPRLHWIVVEDNDKKTKLVENFVANCGLTFTHLAVKTPPDFKMKTTDPNWLKPRGVLQRNLALKWVRNTLKFSHESSVLYFADDDNTYDLRIFKEMRSTSKVSVWPVGIVGGLLFERPLVEDGKVVAWYTYWKPQRPFAMDMAGFAVNTKLLMKYPHAEFSLKVPRGYQESVLLKQLVRLEELEPKADNCSKILVWHTRTEKPSLKNELRLKQKGRPVSDPNIEV
ncbi:galactosylgalactosylxylosylprotein 3-beta-glucuronosyltransferase I-like [Tubulanus polymorphus]|uniref:galactosylgalactosylxylosylprotein 3-beta-glucuronosyltransferase I-like n=1 Tax=Tubulanus polymorphus TaxID=672921 RepID=UPI003DA5583F